MPFPMNSAAYAPGMFKVSTLVVLRRIFDAGFISDEQTLWEFTV